MLLVRSDNLNKPNTRKILLADDHVIIRRGLKTLIDNHFGISEWVETDVTSNILELIELNKITHMILDMQLHDANILEIITSVRNLNPTIPIIIYTMSSEDIFGPRMITLGLNGFLSKQSNEVETINAFKDFFAGKDFFSEHLLEIFADKKQSLTNPINKLSERELLVLNYLLLGNSVKEITIKLNLKTTTVATYKARIFDKLGVNNIIDLRNLTDLYNYNNS